MDRRKFLSYISCSCCGFILNACTTAPITERRQLKIIPEAKLNAQAALIYEKIKEKEKLSKDLKTLNLIKEIGKKMEDSISEYFYRSNLNDPTRNGANGLMLGVILPSKIAPNSYLLNQTFVFSTRSLLFIKNFQLRTFVPNILPIK